jgi:hypothetical protein
VRAEVARWKIRHGLLCAAARGRKALWQSWGARHDCRFVRIDQLGWWIGPDEEGSFGFGRCVGRSRNAEHHSLGVAERRLTKGGRWEFGEKEESMRPRASLHVGQNRLESRHVRQRCLLALQSKVERGGRT